MIGYDTTYYWSVWASDVGGSGETVEEFYSFTHEPGELCANREQPRSRRWGHRRALNPVLSVDVADVDGDPLDITFRTDASGTWQDITTYSGVGDGTYTASPTNMGDYATTYNWRVEVDDGMDPVSIDYSFTTRAEPGTWWNGDWPYRKQITIDHNLVDEDLTGFAGIDRHHRCQTWPCTRRATGTTSSSPTTPVSS